MNLDDEVRRHLRDTGEQVALTPGMVDAVRIRADSRARRHRFIVRGLGTLIVLGAIGGSVGVLSRRTNEQTASLGSVPLIETTQTPELTSTEETVDEDSSASLASPTATYETVASAVSEDTEANSTLVRGSSEARWTKVEGPVTGATTEYMYSGDKVLARVSSQWFVRDGSSWRELEIPASLEVIAVDLGAGEEVLRVAGWLGHDPCTRDLVIQVRDGIAWKQHELPNAFAAGLVSAVSEARLRVTDHELVLSRVEELSLDPVCLLQSRGIDAVDAEIVDGLIYATDRKAGRVVHSLEKLGPFEAQDFLDSGPTKRSLIIRSADGGSWGTTLLVEQRVAELGVVDGLVVHEDLTHTVHDGQRLDRSQLIPPAARQLIDALASSSGMSLIFEREDGIWFRDSGGDQQLDQLTGLPSLWGRLGLVSAELTMVVETSQGPALFVLGG
jgi:hypothetical protein